MTPTFVGQGSESVRDGAEDGGRAATSHQEVGNGRSQGRAAA